MPKYWGNKFSHTGDSLKWVKTEDGEKRKEKSKKRAIDGNNNGQATHGARMPHACRTQAAWAKNMYKSIHKAGQISVSLQ